MATRSFPPLAVLVPVGLTVPSDALADVTFLSMTSYPTYPDYDNHTNGTPLPGDGTGTAYDNDCCIGYVSRVENWAPGSSYHWIVSDGNSVVLDAYANVDLAGNCVTSNMLGWSFCGLQVLWWVDFELNIPIAGGQTGVWTIITTEDTVEVDDRQFTLSGCGNGTQDRPQEECDDGNTVTETCGYVAPHPTIDPPGGADHWCPVCDSTCQEVEGDHWCGDTIVNSNDGETCDDGNAVDGDGCSATCQNECSAWTQIVEPIAIRPAETIVVDGYIRNDANVPCEASLRVATSSQLTLEPTPAPGTKWHLQGTPTSRTVAAHQVIPIDFRITAAAAIDGTAPHAFGVLPGNGSSPPTFGNTAWVVPTGETTTFDGWDPVDAIGDFTGTLLPIAAPFTNLANPQDARVVYESFDPNQSVDSCYYLGSYYAEVRQPGVQSGGWWVDDPLLAPNGWGPDRVGVVPQYNDMITWYRGGPFTPDQQACISSGNCVAPPPLNPSCRMMFLQTMSISCLNFPVAYRLIAYESHALGQDFTSTDHTVYRDDAPPETRVWP